MTRNQILKELVKIEDAIENPKGKFSNQGQGMDGFSALQNFRSIAKKAKEILEKGDYDQEKI